jgi:hypothetical protein
VNSRALSPLAVTTASEVVGARGLRQPPSRFRNSAKGPRSDSPRRARGKKPNLRRRLLDDSEEAARADALEVALAAVVERDS